MENLEIYTTFWKIANAKKLYARYNETALFIHTVTTILNKDLEQFEEIVSSNMGFPGYGKPMLTIEIYSNVEDMYDILRNIFCDAAESNSYTGYRVMQFELANLFTPVVSKAKIS